jgi:hypothetical protein
MTLNASFVKHFAIVTFRRSMAHAGAITSRRD